MLLLASIDFCCIEVSTVCSAVKCSSGLFFSGNQAWLTVKCGERNLRWKAVMLMFLNSIGNDGFYFQCIGLQSWENFRPVCWVEGRLLSVNSFSTSRKKRDTGN